MWAIMYKKELCMNVFTRVFTNNPSYLAYDAEGSKSSYFVFANWFTKFTAKFTRVKRFLYQVSFFGLRPLPGQHRILKHANNFVIFEHFFLTFLISLGEMSLNFATLC